MRHGKELANCTGQHDDSQCLPQPISKGRRTGAIILTHEDGLLAGLFTDSDLAQSLSGAMIQRLTAPSPK